MYTRTETVFSSSNLLYVYKCQHCGYIHSVVQKVTASSTLSARPSLFGPSLEAKEIFAKKKANASLEQKLKTIHTDVANGKYSSARFGCKCPKCRKRPVWASLYSSGLELLFRIFGYISIMAFLFSLLSLTDGLKEWMAVLCFLILPPLSVTFALFIAIKAKRLIYTKKSAKVPKEFLPILCNNATELVEAANNLNVSAEYASSSTQC